MDKQHNHELDDASLDSVLGEAKKVWSHGVDSYVDTRTRGVSTKCTGEREPEESYEVLGIAHRPKIKSNELKHD